MDYQIWTEDDYGETWRRKDAGDLEAAKRIILDASKEGKTVMLTVEVPFDLELKVGEPGCPPKLSAKERYRKGIRDPEEEAKIEADKDKTESDKNTGD